MIEEYSKKIEENILDREKLSKVFYEFSEKVNYDIYEVYKLINKNYISYSLFSELFNSYVATFNMSNAIKTEIISIRTSKSGKNNFNRYFLVFDELLNETNPNTVLEILKNSNVDINYLKSCATDYAIAKGFKNIDSVVIELKNKVDVYINYRNQVNKERRQKLLDLKYEEILPKAREVITSFIDSDFKDKAGFCKTNNIDIKNFDLYIKVLLEKDNDLYNKYYEKMENEKNKRYAYITNKIIKIVELIKNGIEVNGKTREFDILDYYLFTKIDPVDIARIASNILSNEDLVVLKRFLGKNKNLGKTGNREIDNILSSNVEIFCEKDKYGNSIAGTGRIITKEEKLYIIDFLKSNRIPLSTKTYNLAFRRYLTGNLIDNNEEENIHSL